MRQAGLIACVRRNKMHTEYWWENWRKKILWRWADHEILCLGESKWDALNWIRLARDTDKNQAISNTTVRFRVPHNAENFLISWWTARFSRSTLFHVELDSLVSLSASQFLSYLVNVQDVELRTLNVIVEYPSKFILHVDEARYETMPLTLRKEYRLSTRRRCKGE